MSSTNRSNARDSHIADYYVTPVDDIVKFLGAFDEEVTLSIWNRQILDPCAGGDEFHAMSYPKALKEYYAITDSVAYCHMVWKKNDYPKFAKIRVI